MAINFDELEILIKEDRPLKGMWHCGPNNCWITATHIPTQQSVRVYGDQMHESKEKAVSALELLLGGWTGESCNFPEQITDITNGKEE